jgi:hypothetical protein
MFWSGRIAKSETVPSVCSQFPSDMLIVDKGQYSAHTLKIQEWQQMKVKNDSKLRVMRINDALHLFWA